MGILIGRWGNPGLVHCLEGPRRAVGSGNFHGRILKRISLSRALGTSFCRHHPRCRFTGTNTRRDARGSHSSPDGSWEQGLLRTAQPPDAPASLRTRVSPCQAPSVTDSTCVGLPWPPFLVSPKSLIAGSRVLEVACLPFPLLPLLCPPLPLTEASRRKRKLRWPTRVGGWVGPSAGTLPETGAGEDWQGGRGCSGQGSWGPGQPQAGC